MPTASFHFPKGFLWGAATAAHQVEGGNTNNNWAAWEAEPGHIYHDQKAGLACDWWGGRWKEDFGRAAETGQNAHRLSVEWSRIQPTPDRWDEDALDHYRQMLRELVNLGITPMVTLHHFSDPLWLVERGGWEADETPELFEKFVRKVVPALQEYCTLWVPVNEPNVYTYGGWLNGGFPPGKNDMKLAFAVLANLLRGHAKAYKAIHSLQVTARVGSCINYRSFKPARDGIFFMDGVIASQLHRQYNEAFPVALVRGKLSFGTQSAEIPEAVGAQDFVGVNYYTGDLVAFDLTRASEFFNRRFYRPGAELSDTGFLANYPEGMFEALRWARHFNLPILITENGVEDLDDHLRPRYILEHIHQVWRAVNFNWPIKGYFHWSLVDNFEWERGWSQRFGLWGLDVDTQARIRRPSVDLYAAICRENGITSEMVERWAPQIYNRLFPG